ncbi:metal-sulfur cluster assembly factor [Thermoproteus tenax]|uniref:Metal-sulfur cluster biosynthetic enzyme, PaaD family n=1 Tax=Thermoproteus tenax (strain ATCC 35583 / DSM 2078 / JCM 9277 / NBRC 100435 / Kra 1) TaxID=768679 RepID=G4RL99_THETK|nr:metal-sulfur cluster assembly factor [Thermoproteus tenax]CCC82344.1 metal-sulfur cluster biosynthetic enzyme, PaaD family [Thermoproteus tenax Kra 1]
MESNGVVFKTNLPPDKVKKLIEVLRNIYDPEIPINVYDLGLIREITLSEDGTLKIVMTLTAVGCPVSASLANEVGLAVQSVVTEAKDVEVDVDFERPWDPTQMTPEGREMFKAIYGYDIVEQYQQQLQGVQQ